MTYPWIVHLRDHVPDDGDAYLNAWITWWGYHQTLRDPLHLFHANIYYPYRYTYAFSENNYGISLVCFPLFALGVRPLIVNNIATLIGFAFCGYGMFRLTRTLTNSDGAAWLAGIVFAFAPYRFHHLSHVNYLFAGWIPVMLEALARYARGRSWRRALWLGLTFLMNALTCVHWFVLTLIPMALSALYLLACADALRKRETWLRAGASLGGACLVLLPFFIPYLRVKQLYGFERSAADSIIFSALPIHWLTAEWQNKLWRGFGAQNNFGEKMLFPGLLPILLAFLVFLLAKPLARFHSSETGGAASRSRRPARLPLLALDALIVVSLILTILTAGYGRFRLHLFGFHVIGVSDAVKPFLVFAVALLIRFAFTNRGILRFLKGKKTTAGFRLNRPSQAFSLALIWGVTGFCGSFGMNFFFHRLLFEYVPLFRSIRAPARWAMVAYVGLALLAGVGAKRFVVLLRSWRGGFNESLIFACLAAAILFEQRAAPLFLLKGAPDPDALTLRFKETPMRGGIVELPAGGVYNARYVLRSADHARPLVTAFSGFTPPLERQLDALLSRRPVPDEFFDLLESVPVSYVVVHNSMLSPRLRVAFDEMLARGTTLNRLRFIRSYGERDDLYAVVKVEPQVAGEATMPAPVSGRDYISLYHNQLKYLPKDFQHNGYLVYRLYKVSYGRMPRRDEFVAAVQAAGQVSESSEPDAKRHLAEIWTRSAVFDSIYRDKTDDEFIDALAANTGLELSEDERRGLIGALRRGAETRGSVLLKFAEDERFYLREFDAAFVLMLYFGHLQRNPDDAPDGDMRGYEFWLDALKRKGDYNEVGSIFFYSDERKAKRPLQ